MGLETATTISGLEPSYPLSGDDTNRGDDHLRLIKAVLQAQFPGTLGNGYATAILADETELNYLQGLTSNAQDQFDALGVRVDALEVALSAPSGTAMLFYQATAPTGWTIDTTNNNTMLRVVSSAGGVSFTTGDSPILMDKVPLHNHTGTTDSDGSHTHTVLGGYNAHDNCTYSSFSGASTTCGQRSGVASTEGAHTHTITTDNNAGGANWTPNYSSVLVCVKSQDLWQITY